MRKLKAHNTSKFEIRDLGEAAFFLCMEVHRDQRAGELRLLMTQKRYTVELVERFGLQDAKPAPTAMSQSIEQPLQRALGEPAVRSDGRSYPSLLGASRSVAATVKPI